MSKKKIDRKSGGQKQKRVEDKPQTGPDAGRRRIIMIGSATLAATGLGVLGAYRSGWFGSESSSSTQFSPPSQAGSVSSANYQNALDAVNEMLESRARQIGNASVLIHAVRG